MAQYSKSRRTKQRPQPNEDIYEVVMQADENGELWNTRYGKDAWGKPKAILDKSLFNGTFTFNVPTRVWEEVSWDYINEVPALQASFTKVSSRLNMLSVLSGTSAGNGTVARTRKFMRYQPNRGQLFSCGAICPNATAYASREWGLSTAQNGVVFELLGDGTNWDLRLTRRSGGIVIDNVSIKSTVLKLFPGFDPSKGHVYDIQMEWRGVGNMNFFVDLKLVHTFPLLGTLEALSVNDPALPVAFVCTTFDGTERELLVPCVDVSSEGGEEPRTLFATASTGTSLLTLGASTVDTALIALRVPRTVTYNSNSIFNSRGAFMDKLTTWTRDESLTRVFVFRQVSSTNLNGITWTTLPDSRIQYALGGLSSALDTAFATDISTGQVVLSEWADIDVKNEIINPSKNSPFQIVPGDILVVAVRSAGAANVKSSATLYFSEEL